MTSLFLTITTYLISLNTPAFAMSREEIERLAREKADTILTSSTYNMASEGLTIIIFALLIILVIIFLIAMLRK